MSLDTAGAYCLASAIIGDGGYDLFTNGNAALGVGDDDTAFAVGQTKLQAEENSTNALRKAMNAGYPLRDPDSDDSDGKIRFQSTFLTSEGNFQWKEYGVFNDDTASGGQMLARWVETIGTKTSAAQWVFELDVVIGTS
jgi:hypothetical protein